MADVVEQAEEKERRLNKSRKKLERKLVRSRIPPAPLPVPLIAPAASFREVSMFYGSYGK